MRMVNLFVALATTTVLLAGCTSQQEPAEKAVAQVDSALAEFRPDAEKYAAEELQGVDQSLAKLKHSLANKEYSAIVKAAPALHSNVASLKQTVATRKADAEAMTTAAQAEWGDLNSKVPQMVETIQGQVDKLGKSRKLPNNLDKAGFETLKTNFETMKTDWTDASAQFASGQAAEAVRKARQVKAKGDEIMAQLGMTNG